MTAPTVVAGAETASLTMAANARLVQLAIRAQVLRDVTRLWPVLDAKRLNETFPGWLAAMLLLIRNYHGQSAAAASAFYRAARQHAIQSPTPRSLIKLAPTPADEWMSRAFGFAGPGMLSRDTARPNTALSTTLGTASRVALDGGRTTILNTVHEDPVALGYYRVTDGRPCGFCALLAARVALKGRGSLYRTAKSAGFQAHNHCGCSAAPLFTRDQQLPEISRQAAEAYRNRGKGPALVAFRKAWEAHLAQTA